VRAGIWSCQPLESALGDTLAGRPFMPVVVARPSARSATTSSIGS